MKRTGVSFVSGCVLAVAVSSAALPGSVRAADGRDGIERALEAPEKARVQDRVARALTPVARPDAKAPAADVRRAARAPAAAAPVVKAAAGPATPAAAAKPVAAGAAAPASQGPKPLFARGGDKAAPEVRTAELPKPAAPKPAPAAAAPPAAKADPAPAVRAPAKPAAASAPAPAAVAAVPQRPLTTCERWRKSGWEARIGLSLHDVLKEWGDCVGWTVHWDSEHRYVLEAGAVFPGPFEKAAANLLGAFSQASPPVLGDFYTGNKSIVVTTSADLGRP